MIGPFGAVGDLAGCFADHLAGHGDILCCDHDRRGVLSGTSIEGVDGFPGEQVRFARPRLQRSGW